VEDAIHVHDKYTRRLRGFGFVTLDDENVVDEVCEMRYHEIKNVLVECKKALPEMVPRCVFGIVYQQPEPIPTPPAQFPYQPPGFPNASSGFSIPPRK
jgi:hypothetical protein